MTDKHPNQAVAQQYWAAPGDYEWRWKFRNEPLSLWSAWGNSEPPKFLPNCEYELRVAAHKRLRRMRYVGGTITFPAPMREVPEIGTIFYAIQLLDKTPTKLAWQGMSIDNGWLAAGICQATEQGAKEQRAALAELCMEYVDEVDPYLQTR